MDVNQESSVIELLAVTEGNNPADSSSESHTDILTAAKGGGISFAGRIFEYIVRFAFGVLVARFVGAEQYGLYNLAITVSLIGTNAAMLGLQTSMVRFLPPAIHEKDDKSAWGIIQISIGLPLILSLVLAIGILMLANPLADIFFHDLRMVPFIRLASLLVPLDTLASMAYVLTISFKQPKYSVIANNILAPLVKLLLAATFLAVGFSTSGVLVAQIVASAAALVALAYFVNALFPVRRALGSSKEHIRPLLHYALPVYLGWMVNTLRSTFSTLVLGFLKLPTGVGIFTAASRISTIGNMFYLSIGNISTPIIADLHAQHKHTQLKNYYQTTTRWLILFNIPIFLTSVLLAEPLLWIFGDDFTAGATSMVILAIGTLVHTSTGLGANILDMTDHPKINMINSVVMVFVTILLNILLVPRWEVVGAAIASSICTLMVNIVCLVEIWILLGMQPYNWNLIKPLIAGLVAGASAWLLISLIDLSLLLQLLLGGGLLWVIYVLFLFLLKLPADDQLVLDHLLVRLKLKHWITRQEVK